MDPLSIISAVVTGGKTLFAVTESVLAFVDEVRTVNLSIQGIYDEVDSLFRTLHAINRSLASSSLSSAITWIQETSALWPPVLKSLQDCELTIHQLYQSLKRIKGQSSGLAARTVMAIKFAHSDREIQAPKGRIQTHNGSLQLALQTITVHLCTHSPGIVIDDLYTKIELLVDMISQLGSSPDPVARMQSALNIQQAPPSENLLSVAQQVALEANVVLTRSERGSVAGGSLSVPTRSRIESWLEEHSEDNQIERSSTSATSRTQMTPSETTDGRSVTDGPLSADSDTDDEFEMEEIQASLRLTQAAFDRWDYSSAEKFFDKAVSLAQGLSLPKRTEQSLNLSQACLNIAEAAFGTDLHSTAEIFFRKMYSLVQEFSTTNLTQRDLKDAQLKIAVCYFHLETFKEAKTAIMDLRKLPDVSLEDTIRSLEATHLLAEIHLSSNRVTEAKLECEKALSGKRTRQLEEGPDLIIGFSVCAH